MNARRALTSGRLLAGGNRVVRPADFADVYANPWDELARMTRQGVLERLAHGYYLVVPDDRRGTEWRPGIEAVALGLAVADYGRDATTLMGAAAGRLLRAIPRALRTATVAVAARRPPVTTSVGEVQFVTRRVADLDRQRATTEVTVGWTTTEEQTALDLADRPTLGGITPETAAEAIRVLAPRLDLGLVRELAARQRKRGALRRLYWATGIVPPDVSTRRPVPTRGLPGIAEEAHHYGVVETNQ